MTYDVVLIDARSGDWLNNYLNAEAARSAWYCIPQRMQDHQGSGHHRRRRADRLGVGGRAVRLSPAGRQPAGVARKAVWLLRTWSARVYR